MKATLGTDPLAATLAAFPTVHLLDPGVLRRKVKRMSLNVNDRRGSEGPNTPSGSLEIILSAIYYR